MPTIYKGQECLSLDELELHMHHFIRESAEEIPTLLKERQEKLDNYAFSI